MTGERTEMSKTETPSIGVPSLADEPSRVVEFGSRIASAAKSLNKFVSILAVAYLIAGALVWWIWSVPWDLQVVWSSVWRVLLLIALVVPAVVTGLFGYALRQLSGVPPQLLDKVAEGSTHAKGAMQQIRGGGGGKFRRLTQLLRSLFGLAWSGLDAKGAVLGFAATARLLNPFVLICVGVAILAGVGVCLLALVVVGLSL